MFEGIRSLFVDKTAAQAIAPVALPQEVTATSPDKNAKQKAWVVIIADGRVGYIDHYKINGRFGVRPVGFESGLHYPNTSAHWSAEDLLKIPEELALSIREIRAAKDEEIPPMWRSW